MSESDWSQSNALRTAVKESMRLHPVSASGALRQVGRDFVTKSGYHIPQNSHVITSMILLHRNPSVFEDAEKFKPSRWEHASTEQKEAFLIFAAGKQNCVGQSLANAELHSILPKILSQVELEVEDEGTTSYFLTLKPSGAMLKAKAISPDSDHKE